MLTEQAKATIDALSKDELRLEVNKGHRSRFQADNFAYAQSRLQQLEEAEGAAHHGAELAAAKEANDIAKHSNALAAEANATAKNAWRMAVFSVIVAIVAVIVSMVTKG